MKRLEPGGEWNCECGKKHVLSPYVAAHWDIELIHTCKCGNRHSIESGVIELVFEKVKKGKKK